MIKKVIIISVFVLLASCNIKEQIQAPEIPDKISYKKFSIIVLPDTQKYSENYPEIFTSQTQWVVENVKELNIKAVIHLGDIVDDGYSEEQWINANNSMSLLDGIIPYFIIPGNHDYENPGMKGTKNSTRFNNYFSHTRYDYNGWYGGHFPENKNDNSYGFFKVDDKEYLIIGLEFCPTDKVIEWADGVISRNKDKEVIFFTHAYLNADNSRINIGDWSDCSNWEYCRACSGNSGQAIWDKLISKHSNILLVLCGHIAGSGTGRRVDYINNSPVYQILQNYQMLSNGGDGWLRIYTFDREQGIIEASTYSPYLGRYNDLEQNRFSLEWR